MSYLPLLLWLSLPPVTLANEGGETDKKNQVTNAAPLQTIDFQLPKYEQFRLANGLTIKLMARSRLPIMTVSAAIKAGAIQDQIPGTASMTAQSLALGTKSKTKLQIEQQLDTVGASLTLRGGKEASYLSSEFMSKDAEPMLALITELLMEPSFNIDEINKLQHHTLGQLSKAQQSPKAMIQPYFEKFLFGTHPYGNLISGTQDSIAKLNPEELTKFYRSYYQPENTIISVVGDFDVHLMKNKLTQLFAGWHNSPHNTPPPTTLTALELNKDLPKLTSSKVLVVNKEDATETTFIIGAMGIPRNHPDYVQLQVINTVLGGSFTSWLNDALRVDAGLTYGIQSKFRSFNQAGLFEITSFTSKQNTREALDLTLATYQHLWKPGLSQQQLDSTKAYIKGQFPPKYETNGQLAILLTQMSVYGFNDDYINHFNQQVDSLTLKEARALILQYFHRDNLQFVLIGDSEFLSDLAKKYGKVSQVEIDDPRFELQ